MNAVHISSGGRKWNINREKRKRKLPKVATSHATDAEDVMQDMLAAAASQGGRAWKKKKKLLEKREKRRHDASIAEATRSLQKQAKALAKKNRKSGMCAPVSRSELLLLPSSEPFQRCFWPANSRGTHGDSEEPSDALKEYRRSLGIRVALHGNQTDVLGRYCPPPIARVDDPSLPAIFPAFFQVLQQQWQEEHKTKRGIRPTVVQRQAWPALLSGSDCLVVSPTGSGKTLAYLLPLVPHVLAQKAPRPGEGRPARFSGRATRVGAWFFQVSRRPHPSPSWRLAESGWRVVWGRSSSYRPLPLPLLAVMLPLFFTKY